MLMVRINDWQSHGAAVVGSANRVCVVSQKKPAENHMHSNFTIFNLTTVQTTYRIV